MKCVFLRLPCNYFLPPAARGTLFEKTVPLDPRQKLLINSVQKPNASLKEKTAKA